MRGPHAAFAVGPALWSAFAAAAVAQSSGYAFLGDLRSHEQTEAGFTGTCEPGATLVVRFLTPAMVRVTLDRPDRDEALLEGPIARTDWPGAETRLEETADRLALRSERLTVVLDKRHAYEESMRVPMLAWAPGWIEPGSRVDEMILNVDIAPTLLEVAGARAPQEIDGTSFLPLLRGESIPWRDEIAYVYYWEYFFPQTPTTFALRTDRYKYITYHGVWDTDELYDLETDPLERRNLVDDPAHEARAKAMRDRLFERLDEAGALDVPFVRPHGDPMDERGPK